MNFFAFFIIVGELEKQLVEIGYNIAVFFKICFAFFFIVFDNALSKGFMKKKPEYTFPEIPMNS